MTERRRDLERAKNEVSWYIRAHLSTEEAEAMTSPGFRPMPCGGCGRQHCDYCSMEPGEQVHVGGHGKRSNYDPRHVRVIVQRYSGFPQAVVAYAMEHLYNLPAELRLPILYENQGMKTREVAVFMGVSHSTVIRNRERGLEQIVRQIWPDQFGDEVADGRVLVST